MDFWDILQYGSWGVAALLLLWMVADAVPGQQPVYRGRADQLAGRHRRAGRPAAGA